jgi:hypothetical protein
LQLLNDWLWHLASCFRIAALCNSQLLRHWHLIQFPLGNALQLLDEFVVCHNRSLDHSRRRRFNVMRSLIDGKTLSSIANRLKTGNKRVVGFDGRLDRNVVGRSKADRLQ